MMDFGKVDLKEIKSDAPRSKFSEEQIEVLANAILENGGLIRPLILKQSDIDSYSVIDGHLEYYASVRVREKDARKGEMVNAFVIKPQQEKAVSASTSKTYPMLAPIPRRWNATVRRF